MIGPLTLLLALAASDPRPSIAVSLRHGDPAAALAATDAALAESTGARKLGLDYLRGSLLERLGRIKEAESAFRAARDSVPALAPHATLHLGRLALADGRPDDALRAGAAVLAAPPRAVVAEAIALLGQALDKGADCQPIEHLAPSHLPTYAERWLTLWRADCLARRGEAKTAIATWQKLLAEELGDRVAYAAADRLDRPVPSLAPGFRPDLVGLALYQQREFARAVPLLEAALARPGFPTHSFDLRFALARCRFWLGEYQRAYDEFVRLANAPGNAPRRALVFHHAGRAAELGGRALEARAAFARSAAEEPTGEWAGPSLLGVLRLAARAEDDPGETEAVRRLATDPALGSFLARGLLFLASSDLVAGRFDRTADWLARARQVRAAPEVEIAYWQGRAHAAAAHPEAAVESYLEALFRGWPGPFAQAAARRLASPGLAGEVAALQDRLTAHGRFAEDLVLARAVAAAGSHDSISAVEVQVKAMLRAGGRTPLEPAPSSSWPLWSARALDPETLLLQLGLWREGSSGVIRQFPLSRPTLGLAAALELVADGAPREGIALGEALLARLPSGVPLEDSSDLLLAALYPTPQLTIAESEARRRGVAPALLYAILREESRFDPTAFSLASARGLGQLVLPTARRLAAKEGAQVLSPEDLDQPEVSISLAAAYLAELAGRFGGREEAVVAAYNAGEPQTELWLSYCKSKEPEEFLTKVSFRETRGYISAVLGSRARYAERLARPAGR